MLAGVSTVVLRLNFFAQRGRMTPAVTVYALKE
jgi:hypothetical protein